MARLQHLLVAALNRHLAGGRPVVPEAGVLLWNLFGEIAGSRTYHAAGPNPISHAEIEAFARLHRWPLQQHHIAILRAMDEAWVAHVYAETRRSQNGGKSLPTGREQAITATAFDAVFG